VGEHWERQAELAAVERACGLADHDRVPPPVGVRQVGEEARRFGPALPRQGPRPADVEVLSDDHPAGRGDELVGALQLPAARCGRVLRVFG
jgi:hypothetical protein